MDDRSKESKKTVFLSFKDKEQTFASYVTLLEQNELLVKFRYGDNIFIVPMHRIIKIRESI